jgi:hypothetical protein
MKKTIRKWTAAWVAIAFTWMAMGIISPGQLKAGTTKTESAASTVEAARGGNSETNSFEKEGASPEITKKKKFPWLWVAAGVVVAGVIVYFTLIKKPKYDLTVDVGTGVSGTPAAGKYTYKKGEKILYSFSSSDGYKNLNVLLDGNPVAASGTMVMDRAHTLKATAEPLSNYTLTVKVEPGINGSPAAGTYRYREGTTISYQYSALNSILSGKLDGSSVPLSGSFQMDRDHVLEVTSEPPPNVQPDIRGNWRFLLKKKGETQTKPALFISFSGKRTKGDCKVIGDLTDPYWSDWQSSNWLDNDGHYDIASEDPIFWILGDNTSGLDFFNMIFKSDNFFSGEYELYEGDPPLTAEKGTWTATRIE